MLYSGADVLLVVRPRVTLRRVVGRAGHPSLEDLAGLCRLEVVHQVPQPKDPAGTQQAGDPVEGDRLPEVGQLVESVARVDAVDRRTSVLVGEEPGLDAGEVGHSRLGGPGPQQRQHGR